MPFIAPVVAAVSGALAGAASFIGGSLIGKVIVGVGLNLAASKLLGKAAGKPQEQPRGTKLETQYGGSRAREVIVGTTATAGQDVYTNTFGDGNVFIHKVFILSDFPIHEITRIAVDGEWRGFVGGEDHRGRAIEGYADGPGQLWVKLHRGLPNQPADAHLIGTANPAGRWTEDHVGAGVAYAVVLARFDDEKMSSFPALLFECRGVCYDPRFDDSVGGSGPQRWNDIASYGTSDNPIVQAYNYERGFFVNGQLIVGKTMRADELPLAYWLPAMNVCDEIVDDGLQRYRSGFIFSAEDGREHHANLKPVLNAAAADLVERVDGDVPLIGANQPLVPLVLTDDDLIVDAPVTYQAKRSRSGLINTVHGSVNSPDDLWSKKAYAPQWSDDAITADGERRAVSIDFDAVYSARQGAVLAQTAVRENRYQASATITVRPRWQILEPGDWFEWDSLRFGKRTWRVVETMLGALNSNNARNVELSLQEVGNGIYDHFVSIPEGPGRLPLPGPLFQSTVYGFDAFPTTVTAENGRIYPAITAFWTPIEDVTVDAVIVEYWKQDDPANRIQTRVEMPSQRVLIVEGLLPETTYELQATVVTNPPRSVFWSALKTVTTLNEQFAIGLGDFNPDIQYILDRMEENWRRADELFDEMVALATANLTDLELEANRINNKTFDLGSDVEQTGIRITEEVVRLETLNEVLAARAIRIEARLDDPENGLVAQSVALDTLSTRVTKTEEGIETAAESLRGVRSEIEAGFEASGQALDTLQTKVTQNGEDIEAQSRSLTQLQSDLTDAERDISANASAVSNLSTTVSTQGSTITSESRRLDGAVARIGSTESSVSGLSSSLTQTNNRVTQQGNTINAQAETLSDTRVRANNASAGAMMRVEAIAGPGGTAVRYAYQFRRSLTNENYQTAGWFVDLSPSGVPTVVFDFTRFIVTDSSNRMAQPFRFENGTLFSTAAVFSYAIVGRLVADQIEARSINAEKIAINGVFTGNIGIGAISGVAVLGGGTGAAIGITTDGGLVEITAQCDIGSDGMDITRDGDGVVMSFGAVRVVSDVYELPSGGLQRDFTFTPTVGLTVIAARSRHEIYRISRGRGVAVIKNFKR